MATEDKFKQQEAKQQRLNPLQRKIETITADLTAATFSLLSEQSEVNAMTICNYILAMKAEINPTKEYKKITIQALCYLARFYNHQKPFAEMTRDDIILHLDSLHKPEIIDPMHRFVGTYNLRRVIYLRFFRWLYSPTMSQTARPTPEAMQNIPKLRRKEISTVKPADLWNDEDHVLFLKYCDNKRDKAYHAIAMDSSCRPSEILGLRVKDLNFLLTVDKKQYAQITVNGKTGTRKIPLFTSIPYIKDWLTYGHPTAGNPNAYLIPSLDTKHHSTRGNKMLSASMNDIYRRKYKNVYFPALLEDPKVAPEDKTKIRDLLAKPFNPYIQRHSALTQKAQKLKDPILKMHAGWSQSSRMNLKYEHWFGNEDNDTILSELYGLETAATLKSKNMSNAIAPKVCPNCSESNKPDSKFCSKCRMVLKYDAYIETIEEKQDKDREVQGLKEEMVLMQQAQKEILDLLKDPAKLLEVLKEN